MRVGPLRVGAIAAVLSIASALVRAASFADGVEVAKNRVRELVVHPNQSPVTETLSVVTRYDFAYPDGPRDAETACIVRSRPGPDVLCDGGALTAGGAAPID